MKNNSSDEHLSRGKVQNQVKSNLFGNLGIWRQHQSEWILRKDARVDAEKNHKQMASSLVIYSVSGFQTH